jgi:ABC-type polysaccharide/polyol phosphate export permease
MAAKFQNGGGLGKSFRIQIRVIWALVLREILTRYGRHNIGFLWLFVEPMLFTLGVTALWTLTGLHHGSNLPITAFALTGYSTVLLWRNMPARCVNAILPNSALMYHRNVRVIDIFLSRIALEAIGATISFVSLSILFVFLGWMDPPENALWVLQAWLLTMWFGAALAMLLGTWSERSEIVEKLWHPAAYLLFPLSGAAYLVDALPKAAQDAVLWLPMVHGTEMVREGYFGSKIVAHYDVTYLVTINMVLTLFALALERVVSREFIPE